jgi:hypothetical protein
MNIINQFLGKSVNRGIVNINEGLSRLDDINAMFEGAAYRPSYIHALPQVKPYQIWTIKNNYLDYEGQRQSLCHPMMVLLTSDCEDLDDDISFVRGCPISPFIEMATDDDIVCRDASLIGFPFLIESWNEQPMLVDVLDKYVADFYTEVNESDSNVDEIQQSFRDIEISNARYLNNSIMSYINEMERSENFSFSVVVSFADYIKTKHMPVMGITKPRIVELPLGEEYAMAAKTGNRVTDNDCIDFCTDELPFKIEVRKKNKGYVMTIIPRIVVSLLDNNNEEINGVSNSERIVFENLKKGLYTIISPLVNNRLTIRLK